MDLEVTEYRPGDLSLMNVRAHDLMVSDPEDYIYGMALVLWDGVTPVAVGGIAIVSPGVGNGWSYISDDARPFALQVVRFAKETMREVMTNLGLHRVHVTVKDGLEQYSRFAEILGFRSEGVLRAAAPDRSDLRMMAIVREP